jgi:Leucine-rich repeat (LRR) protein
LTAPAERRNLKVMLRGFISAAVVCLALSRDAGFCAPPDGGSPAIGEAVRQWAADLDHADFGKREAAQRKLLESGVDAVEPVAAIALRGGLEGRTRATSILTSLFEADDTATYQKAKEALWRIALIDDARIAEMACRILAAENEALQKIMEKIEVGFDSEGRAVSVTNCPAPGGDHPGLFDRDLARLKIFPDLVRLDLSGEVYANDGYKESCITDAGLAHLKAFKKLEFLELEGGQVTDAGMRHVATASSLKTLRLSGQRITEKGLAPLRALTNLETLDLEYTGVRDLRSLAPMPNLQTLTASDAPFIECGLEGLKGLTNLKVLKLSFGRQAGNRFARHADKELLNLRFLTKLEQLELKNVGVSNDGLAGLRELVELRQLKIQTAPITDEAVSHLANLGKLERLELYMTGVRGSGLRHLNGLTKLKSLRVVNQLSTDELHHLPALPALEDLYAIYRGPTPDRGAFQGLRGMSSLRELSFSPINDQTLEHLVGAVKLETLQCGKSVTDAGAELIGKLTALRLLHLHETQVTDAGMSYLKPLMQLRELSLGRTRISDEGIKQIAGLPRLNRLFLNGTAITDAAVPYLERFSQLATLSIEETRISEDGVRRIREKLPKCVIMATIKQSKPRGENAPKPKPAKAG